eukprot:gene24682-29825_t
MDTDHDLRSPERPQCHVLYELADVDAEDTEPAGVSPRALLSRQASVVLTPHQGTSLHWSNVHYDIPARGLAVATSKKMQASRNILNNISGQALPRQLLAILGRSGAGKTTLLDVLAGRLESPSLKGQLTVNGRHVDKRILRMETGYVMQSD